MSPPTFVGGGLNGMASEGLVRRRPWKIGVKPPPHADRLFGIVVVVVVVVFSAAVQGSLVPAVARRLRLPMHTTEPQAWALGVRGATSPKACTASPSPPARLLMAAASRRSRMCRDTSVLLWSEGSDESASAEATKE
jgi:hypothetical protein